MRNNRAVEQYQSLVYYMCRSGAIGRVCAEQSGCITISIFGVLYVNEWSDRSCMCGTIGQYNNLSL